jgi:hypothetical protein
MKKMAIMPISVRVFIYIAFSQSYKGFAHYATNPQTYIHEEGRGVFPGLFFISTDKSRAGRNAHKKKPRQSLG